MIVSPSVNQIVYPPGSSRADDKRREMIRDDQAPMLIDWFLSHLSHLLINARLSNLMTYQAIEELKKILSPVEREVRKKKREERGKKEVKERFSCFI
jgi:hypothetical protein